MSEPAASRSIGVDDPCPSRRRGRTDFVLRIAAVGAAAIIVCLLIAHALIWISNAHDAVAYPFTLNYGEGIVWQQALLIPGPRMYGPITDAPFIVFHYPPVYHLAVRAAVLLGIDPLAAGRGLSFACTLVLAALCAWLAGRGLAGRVGRSALSVGCIIAGLLPLSLQPVEKWSVLMRVDMLAVCLSFLGVSLIVESARRPGWLAPAMLVFILAVFTKQTSIAAPVAGVLVSLAISRRATVIAILCGAALGLGVFGWLEWLTHGGFGRHILLYNINPFSTERLVDMLLAEKAYALLILSAIGGLALLWWNGTYARKGFASDRAPGARVVFAIFTLWLILASGMLVTVGKDGSDDNYFIEVMCVCAVLTGILAGFGCQAALENRSGWRSAGMRAMLLCLSVAIMNLLIQHPPLRFRLPNRNPALDNTELTEIRRVLVQEIALSKSPVISEDMILLLRAGREVPIEPSIFKALANTGTWDQTLFLQLLSNHFFGFIVLTDDRRYTREVWAAIEHAYPRIEHLGPYTIRRPSES